MLQGKSRSGHAMGQEIALAISVGSFGFVVGFLTGYAVRAYLSYMRHRLSLFR